VVVRTTTIHGSTEAGYKAFCLPGERATGGGAAEADGSGSSTDVLHNSGPVTGTTQSDARPAQAGDTPTGWRADFDTSVNPHGSNDINVYVICESP
jgi:hypothetical protein